MELFHVIAIIIGMISLSYAVSANFKAKEDQCCPVKHP